jgi:hypothetical protein
MPFGTTSNTYLWNDTTKCSVFAEELSALLSCRGGLQEVLMVFVIAPLILRRSRRRAVRAWATRYRQIRREGDCYQRR